MMALKEKPSELVALWKELLTKFESQNPNFKGIGSAFDSGLFKNSTIEKVDYKYKTPDVNKITDPTWTDRTSWTITKGALVNADIVLKNLNFTQELDFVEKMSITDSNTTGLEAGDLGNALKILDALEPSWEISNSTTDVWVHKVDIRFAGAKVGVKNWNDSLSAEVEQSFSEIINHFDGEIKFKIDPELVLIYSAESNSGSREVKEVRVYRLLKELASREDLNSLLSKYNMAWDGNNLYASSAIKCQKNTNVFKINIKSTV